MCQCSLRLDDLNDVSLSVSDVSCWWSLPSWSPPETKDTAIDSPDAQRQEWFAQYFSFWSTTNLQNTRIQHVNQTLRGKKKQNKQKQKLKKKKKKKKKKEKLFFVIYCHRQVFGDLFALGSVDWWRLHKWNAHGTWCHWFSPRNVTMTCFLTSAEAEAELDPDARRHLWSHLIVWFSLSWLFSLWTSFSLSTVTMIIRPFDVSFYFLTYFTVTWN